MTIYQKVKEIRKSLKLTQVDFSRRVGVGLRFLRELEQGKPTIRMDKLMQVLTFLGYTLELVRKTAEYEEVNNFQYGAPWGKQLRLKIRTRDGFICQICKKTDADNRLKYHKPLSIHHIDYDKHNCKEDNLISLCCGCHGRTGKTKEFWKEYFTKLLNSAKVV